MVKALCKDFATNIGNLVKRLKKKEIDTHHKDFFTREQQGIHSNSFVNLEKKWF